MAPKRKPKNKINARRMVWNPTHPLATKNGYVAEARMVLFDKVGFGPHPCHWCKKVVDWKVIKGAGTQSDCIVVDHFNNNWRNNAPSNLVVSCQGCNGSRQRAVRDNELFVVTKSGTRHRAIRRKCERCHTEFLIAPANVKRGRGRFCSRSCARRQPRVYS